MASPLERQRRRRKRLREAGFVDVTVTVPASETARLRRIARAIAAGQGDQPAARLPLVIRSLRAARPHLESLGIVHAGVFGSTARGEEREGSDVDIAVDLDPGRVRDLVEFFDAADAVRQSLPFDDVDVVDRRSLNEDMEKDLIHAF